MSDIETVSAMRRLKADIESALFKYQRASNLPVDVSVYNNCTFTDDGRVDNYVVKVSIEIGEDDE